MKKHAVTFACVAFGMMSPEAHAGTLGPGLEAALETIAARSDATVGACVSDGTQLTCVNGDRPFSLQSVMKLVVAMAVMDAVDERGWQLDTQVTVRREDLSLYVQPIAKLVTDEGYQTTIGDLVRRAVVDSDSAATDILVARLGGIGAVQSYLRKKGIEGVRVDRDERHLQTEIVGLTWKPEYVDADVLKRAINAVPEAQRDGAFRRYRTDIRDTATPRGMTHLLQSLSDGRMLSAASTRHLLEIMNQTKTFPDRLKAGMAPGWKIGHKTGSSGSYKGISVATNDVGLITAPDLCEMAIAVFIGDSTAPSDERNSIIAQVARSVVAHYRSGSECSALIDAATHREKAASQPHANSQVGGGALEARMQ